jgi:ABC-type transport system involved in cytochrome c biogenesis permease subunit
LFLSWIIAVFYLYGSIHHRRQAWGFFVLPLVLGLIGLADLFPLVGPNSDDLWLFRLFSFEASGFWGALHGTLLLLSGVGVCVGFLASVMFLVQLQRLKSKTPPQQGLRLHSLERLEQMNRRAIIVSFPLLTAGMLVGLILMTSFPNQLKGWVDPRVLGALVLWLDFVILLYLRYNRQVSGRRAALLTILAFLMLLVTIAVPHTVGGGGLP